MDEIKISKAKLLTKLKANRAEHRKVFEDALHGWEHQVLSALQRAVDDALQNKRYITMINLPRPSDHTEDYDKIIAKVEWHEEDIIELDSIEFEQYILDNWNWKAAFTQSSASYSGSSSRSSKG